MFIGHYAAGLAAKKAAPKISLGILFFGTQFLDLLFPILVILGIEDVRLNYSLGTFNGLDLLHVPWSHGLVFSLVWSLLIGLTAGLFYKCGKSGIVLGLCVFSHWILDWVTHIPDLPLWMSAPKFGLGLWTNTYATLAVEGLFYLVSLTLYLKTVKLENKKQKGLFWGLMLFLVFLYLGNMFGPKGSEAATAIQVASPMVGLWLTVVWAHFAEKL